MDGRAELASCSERRIEGREGTAGRGGAVLNANLPSGFSHSLTLEQQTHQTIFPALALVFLLLPSLPLYCLHLIFGLFFFAPLFARISFAIPFRRRRRVSGMFEEKLVFSRRVCASVQL